MFLENRYLYLSALKSSLGCCMSKGNSSDWEATPASRANYLASQLRSRMSVNYCERWRDYFPLILLHIYHLKFVYIYLHV